LTSCYDFRQLNGSSLLFAFNGSHLMPIGTFSATLTTRDFDPSRLRWFATCSCKPIAGGLLSLLFSHLPSPTPLAAAHSRQRARNYSQVVRNGSIASRIPVHSGSPSGGRMRHGNTPLGHHCHEIPIAQPIGDVPANAQLDDLGIETAAAVNGISDYRPGHLGVS